MGQRRSIADDRRWGREPRLECSARVLREARAQAGLALREVTRVTGLSAAQLSDMEAGIGSTPLCRVAGLCEVLLLPPEVLVAAILQDQVSATGFRLIVRCELVTTLNDGVAISPVRRTP